MSRKSNFRLYRVWDGIIQRCCNPNAKNYSNYGGRGIYICDEWKNNFSAFEEFCLTNGWKYGLQVDRIDNNKGYCPNNIQFVTRAENLRNNGHRGRCACDALQGLRQFPPERARRLLVRRVRRLNHAELLLQPGGNGQAATGKHLVGSGLTERRHPNV